jgi:rhodanese-related sulfurtransferase
MNPRPVLLAALLAAPLLAPAQSPEPPAAELDAAQLEALLLGGKPLAVVDARSESEYVAAHVPGALGIPAARTREEAGRLPADKTVPVVFYCRGPACPLARKGATEAWRLGHRTILIYPGGLPDWKAKGKAVATGAEPGKLAAAPK